MKDRLLIPATFVVALAVLAVGLAATLTTGTTQRALTIATVPVDPSPDIDRYEFPDPTPIVIEVGIDDKVIYQGEIVKDRGQVVNGEIPEPEGEGNTTEVEIALETVDEYVGCPFPNTTGRTIVDFTDDASRRTRDLMIRANGSEGDAIRHDTVELAPGTYMVEAASFSSVMVPEVEAAGPSSHQTWRVEAYNSSMQKMATSESVRDAAPGELAIEAVGEMVFSEPTRKIFARHTKFPSGESHAIVPLCIAMTLLEELPEEDDVTQTNTEEDDEEVVTTTTETTTEETGEETALVAGTRSCPLPQRDNRTVVDFTRNGTVALAALMVRANGTKYQAAVVPRVAPLLPGTYDVRYASYVPELVSSRTSKESWSALLFDATGALVDEVSPSRDVPDYMHEYVGKLDSPVSIEDRITKVGGLHVRHPDDDPHLVIPLCVSFDLLEAFEEESTGADEAEEVEVAIEKPVVRETTIFGTDLPEVAPTVKTISNDTPVSETPPLTGDGTILEKRSVPPAVLDARNTLVKEQGRALLEVFQGSNEEERAELVQKLMEAQDIPREQADDAPRPARVTLVRVERDTADTETGPQNTDTLIERRGLLSVHDADGDGITDYDEEYIYHTDPDNAFTAGGVLTDGERVLLGMDPTVDALETVSVESPRTAGPVDERLFTVDVIEAAPATDTVSKSIRVAGTAQPLAFVTLYLYSTPIIVTVQADAAGNYEYHFDETLEDGSHTVYVASVNNAGKIIAKTNPIPFVKTAEAVEFVPQGAPADPVARTLQGMVTVGLLLLLVLSLGTVVWIGMHRVRREEQLVVGSDHEAENT